MFTRILVPTDFSDASDAALDYARALAGRFASTLHLVHVLDAPFVTGPISTEVFMSQAPAVQEELFEEARARLARRAAAAERAHLRVTTEIVSGTTARAIVDIAADRAMDLIVMGTHGRSGMAHLLMGSVAERVVRTAPCPVLTVRCAPAAEILPLPVAAAAASA
jgi:nucleotide-binding universal stress UspA family protein